MEVKTLKIRNSQIAFYDQGHGNPIVMIHGFAGSKRYWEKIIPELSKKNRLIALDLPGHGDTETGVEKYSMDKMAELIKELLDQLKLERVTMFGHSMGGYVTLAFAEKFAQNLNGFSLVHSTAYPDTDEAKKARETSATKVREGGLDEFIEDLAAKLFSPDNLEKNAEYIKKVEEIGKSTSIEGVVNALHAMKDRPDRRNVLERTHLPVLLIAGEEDQVIPVEKTFSVKKENIKQHLLKDSGHMSMYEQPEDLVLAIEGFLSKI